MSLAVAYASFTLDARAPEPAPKFPRLARPPEPKTPPPRVRAETPPAPHALEEQDAERWDGMG